MLEFDITQRFAVKNPLEYAVPVFVLLIAVEIVISLKYDKENYQWKDFGSSISMGVGAAILAIFTKAVSLLMFWGVYELFNPIVGNTRVNIMGWEAFSFIWFNWIICQVADDFNYYWHHRLSHTVRCLWAAHIVHHSSPNFNLGTAVRNGWVTLFYKPIYWLWLPAIGFHPVMVASCLAIQAMWQFQLHSKFIPHLGFLEIFMNTHTQHRVHHAQNIAYMDKNHGGYLNIFDRMFGTHLPLDESMETKYGVTNPPNSYNPLVIVSHEYKDIFKDVRSTKNWKHKFMYIFGPPGWSPDGSTKTVKQLQREIKQIKKDQPALTSNEIEELLVKKYSKVKEAKFSAKKAA